MHSCTAHSFCVGLVCIFCWHSSNKLLFKLLIWYSPWFDPFRICWQKLCSLRVEETQTLTNLLLAKRLECSDNLVSIGPLQLSGTAIRQTDFDVTIGHCQYRVWQESSTRYSHHTGDTARWCSRCLPGPIVIVWFVPLSYECARKWTGALRGDRLA